MIKRLLLLIISINLLTGTAYAQMAEQESRVGLESPSYLLLDKSLQFRITEAVNSLYDFDFETADRGFKLMAYNYPDHPLPYFLMGLSQWWKITPNTDNQSYDDLFFRYMDESIEKAQAIYDADPNNKEAAFFLAAAYGFEGRLHSERKNWTK